MFLTIIWKLPEETLFMNLVSIQMGKQFSTPGKATKVFLGDGLKSRRILHAYEWKKK